MSLTLSKSHVLFRSRARPFSLLNDYLNFGEKKCSSSSMFNGGQILVPQKESRICDLDPNNVKILHVDASHTHQSLVSLATQNLFQKLDFSHQIETRNLWNQKKELNYNVTHVAAKMRLIKGNGSEEDRSLFQPVLELAEELNRSNILVISTPMWNFSFPYVVKQYIDIVVQPGINFMENPERPVTSNKTLVMISSSGGSYGEKNPRDYLHSYLQDIFGMLGYDKTYAVKIQGAAKMPREKLIAFSNICTQDIAQELNKQFSS